MRGQPLAADFSNTEDFEILLMHPGDEIFSVYGASPKTNAKSIKITPKDALTMVQLRMKAFKDDWRIDDALNGQDFVDTF